MKKFLYLFLILSLTGCSSSVSESLPENTKMQIPEITVSASEPPQTDISDYNASVSSVEPLSSNTLEPTSLSQNEEVSMNPNRITYQPDFYYEPLSESIKARITGHSYAVDCTIPYEALRYVSVQHYDFDGEIKTGEIICSTEIAQDLVEIFYELYNAEYPIEQIRLIDEYNADDELSCLDNNSSCFNYRVIAGTTKLSKHAQGLAIDINPLYNPYITYPDGIANVFPYTATAYANRESDFIAKITHEDLCYQLFTEHGFTWGGDWNSVKDYQHFEK